MCARGAATRNLLDQSCQGVREAGIYQGCGYLWRNTMAHPSLFSFFFVLWTSFHPATTRKGEGKGDVDRGSSMLPIYRTLYVPIGIILVNFEAVSDPLLCSFSAGKIKKPRTVCSVKVTIGFLRLIEAKRCSDHCLLLFFLMDNGDILEQSREFKNRKDLLYCSGMSITSINGVMEIVCISFQVCIFIMITYHL